MHEHAAFHGLSNVRIRGVHGPDLAILLPMEASWGIMAHVRAYFQETLRLQRPSRYRRQPYLKSQESTDQSARSFETGPYLHHTGGELDEDSSPNDRHNEMPVHGETLFLVEITVEHGKDIIPICCQQMWDKDGTEHCWPILHGQSEEDQAWLFEVLPSRYNATNNDGNDDYPFPHVLKAVKWEPMKKCCLFALPCQQMENGFMTVNVMTVLHPPILVTPFFRSFNGGVRRFTMFYNAHTFEMMHSHPERRCFQEWDQIIVVAHSNEHHTRLCDIEEEEVEPLMQILMQFDRPDTQLLVKWNAEEKINCAPLQINQTHNGEYPRFADGVDFREFGTEISYHSPTWLEDLASASSNLENLTIAFKAVDINAVVVILHAACRTLRSLLLKVIEGHVTLDVSRCERLSTLNCEVQMTDVAFIANLLHGGAANLWSLSVKIICNDRDWNLQPHVERWKEWFQLNPPIHSTIIRFTLNFNRRGVASWRRTLDQAVEVSEQALHAHLLANGMTILGIVEHPVPPLEFASLMF
ncbi:hypothetical protein ARMSODRAFT_973473 [Armillaria solidipes]|uniref:Uncharacterized protein n=1 Tax=Armillaria solidipes TaxID=1076256 RepID=A0A2H3BY78_9AGAR|nr:hypothetical protein ARMSODRAFT_973473 [Armillaria solidipes]